jgi:multidrug resistance efflux pump
VSAGQELARLGNPAVEREAVSSAAQLEWLDARAHRTPRPGTRTPAPSATDDIPARILEVRRQRFEKMKALRKSGDITERELEQAEVEYLAAKREYDLVRHAASPGALPATGEDRELLRIEREKALADQRFATQRKELLRIVSPLGGVITGVHAAKGQAIFPRDPIAEVADVTTLQVRGDVAPELMRYLRPGMPVNVRIFSVPTRAFSDEIEYVVPVQGAGSSSRAGTVVVTIPNPDGALQPNTQALITLRSLR